MTFYRFYINGILLDPLHEEPTSWDGQEYVITRSKEYFGFENSYSNSIRFWGDGATIIREAYESEGIEARLTFKIERSCDRGKTWVVDVDGMLNCATYTYMNGEVSVLLEESDFGRTFKNRMDTVISLDATTSLDGLPISDIQPTEVTLRSKAIVQYSSLLANPELLDISESNTFSPAPTFNAIFFPYQQGKIQDLKQTNEVSPFFYFNQWPYPTFAPPFFVNQNTSLLSNIKLSYKLKGQFINSSVDDVEYFYSMTFSYGNTTEDNIIYLVGSPSIFVSGSGSNGFSFDLEGEFEIPGNTPYVWLGITISNYRNFNTVSPNPSLFRLITDKDSFIKLSTESLFPDTTSNVYMIHEALAKTCEIITGEKDCFKSEYFGSGNSQPRQYNLTGCQRYVSLTNGINIRNMFQANGERFPLNISFSQLYKALDAVFCLGMRLEYDESESRWFVRVEKREYFFDKNYDLEFSDVSNIKVSASLENYYNGVSIGYKKWQMNNGQTNGLDEFNTTRTYSILNKNANKTLDIKSEAITGGYPIEFTRRQQFNLDSTKDFETDSNIFFICLNRVPVTSNGATYDVGKTNETNELFSSVTNLVSPETAYNLRLSPARNMYRWLRYLKCSLHKKSPKVIVFTSGEGNYQMITEHDPGYCEPTCPMDENANWEGNTNCFNEAGEELISPEIIEFEIPFDFSIFTQLLGNANKSIRVNCSTSRSYKGFLSQNNFKPNQKEGGTAKFTLITTPSNGAAFSSGFDEGFDSIA